MRWDMKKLFLRAEFGPLWDPWEVDETPRKWILTMAFWATCKIAQPIQPIWQHIFALPWSAFKKPPWEFNFLHIFGIPSSSRHEKRCANPPNTFFGYFNTLETHSELSLVETLLDLLPFLVVREQVGRFRFLILCSPPTNFRFRPHIIWLVQKLTLT